MRSYDLIMFRNIKEISCIKEVFLKLFLEISNIKGLLGNILKYDLIMNTLVYQF